MGNTLVTGVDLVYLPRFKKALKNGGQPFLHRVFHEAELTNQDIAHLAGIFAAKEAVIKALGLPVDSFHEIRVMKLPSGSPKVEIINLPAGRQGHQSSIINHALSISHDGDYVIAQFVALLKP